MPGILESPFWEYHLSSRPQWQIIPITATLGGQLPHSFLLLFLTPGRDRCGSWYASDDWVTLRGSKRHDLLALSLHVCRSQWI